MNTLQTFSHCHRPRKRIGTVKLPFIAPDKIASKAPVTIMAAICNPWSQFRSLKVWSEGISIKVPGRLYNMTFGPSSPPFSGPYPGSTPRWKANDAGFR